MSLIQTIRPQRTNSAPGCGPHRLGSSVLDNIYSYLITVILLPLSQFYLHRVIQSPRTTLKDAVGEIICNRKFNFFQIRHRFGNSTLNVYVSAIIVTVEFYKIETIRFDIKC
jgi:hypothetical protein